MLEVSVVIPALNAEATIGRCLKALARQTLPRGRYEVIVVDDGSRDRTAEIAEGLGARVLRLGRTGGQAAGRNAGVAASHGEILVFTDADCEPIGRFLEALVTPLDDPAVGGTKGVYRTRQSSLVARFVQLEYEDRYRVTARREWIDFVDTYAACFRRRDFDRVGGFDPRLRVCEDQELSFRLAEAGVRIRFVPEAATYHRHADRLWAYLRKKFWIAWWKVAVLRRHPDKAVRDSHTPQTLKVEMLAAFGTCGSLLVGPLVARLGWRRLAWGLPAGGLASFLALAVPFAVRAFAKDPAVGLASPAILFLRDLALGAGLAVGLISAPRLGPISESSVSAPRATPATAAAR